MTERRLLKDLHLKILSELMKNSHESDRDIAKKFGISQPTVSRVRNQLLKEGYIKEYTVMPDFNKLGYSIMAFTFPKLKTLSKEQREEARKISLEDMKKAPSEIILFERGIGTDFDGVIISLHKDYTSYARLLRRTKDYPFIESCKNLLIDLNDKIHFRSLTLSTFADHLLETETKEPNE